jgi:excinuclease ABC subunit A
MLDKDNTIEVQGARVHNLKNIDVSIPREKTGCNTGLSGSGKSSLAFDTIYAEGQRRRRNLCLCQTILGGLERPDVDKIDGLSPVIAIEQKTAKALVPPWVQLLKYDFLRLLYARARMPIVTIQERKWSAILTNKLNL